MNKRIQELVLQARKYVADAIELGFPQDQIDDIRDEKFAELIVGECLDIVNRKEYSYHEADPLWETAELIKEHFGVDQ